MNLTNITNVVRRLPTRGILQIKKYSPQILTGAGIVGGVVTTVLASKATLQLEGIIDDIQKDVADVKRVSATPEEESRDLAHTYVKGGVKLLRLYAPALSVGAASAICVISAQGIMQSRNAALVVAYSALEKGFNEYRERVASVVGEDKEAQIRHGITKVESVSKDKDTGDITTTVKVDKPEYSIYARFFDELNPNWNPRAEYNRIFLDVQQTHANHLLESRGHLFLNEVYDMLGLPRSSAGQVVGWVLSKDGDNYVDFGLFRNSERSNMFV